MNKNLLRAALALRGMSQANLADEMGITPITFGRKLRNDTFSLSQVRQIVELLKLDRSEAIAIFFPES